RACPAGPARNGTDTIQIILAAKKVEIEIKRWLSKDYTDMFEKEQQDARSLMQYELEDDRHRDGIASTKSMYDTIMKRVQELQLTSKDAGGYDAKLIHPPGLGRKVAPNA